MKIYSISGNLNEESLKGDMSRYNYGQVYVSSLHPGVAFL